MNTAEITLSPSENSFWPRVKKVISSPYFHWALIIAWGIWITGTPFRFPFIFGDEGDGYYHGLQVRELRDMGFAGLHVNHPFLFVFYLDFWTWLFHSFREQVLRCSMMIFGVATGLLVYQMGFEVTKKRSLALLSGLTLFYLPVYSLFSQRISHEAPTGFFMTLTWLIHLKILLEPENFSANKRRLVWAAVWTAVACNFNFTGYFNGISWLLVLTNCKPELRKRVFWSAAIGFTVAFVFYAVIAYQALGKDVVQTMIDTGKQRMTFRANPNGKGRLPVMQWFWECYIRRMGWLNPLAYLLTAGLCVIHPNKIIKRFFIMLFVVANMNIFIFSTGALGWICYFYYFAVPLAIAPWEMLRLWGEKKSPHSQSFYRWAPQVLALALFFISQPFVKKAFTTPGSQQDWDRYGVELKQMNRIFVTKPDIQPLYEKLRLKMYGWAGVKK